jgi:hypothetical protein
MVSVVLRELESVIVVLIPEYGLIVQVATQQSLVLSIMCNCVI